MSSPAKRQNVGHLTHNEKRIVKNVFEYVKNDQNCDLSVDDCVTKCSLMTGVSKATVYRILRDEKEGGIDSPKKRPGRKELQLTDDTKQAVRRIVHDFFMEKRIPTLDMILQAATSHPEIPKISRVKLWSVLKGLNFHWKKCERKSLLIESGEIVHWRRDYLRKVRKARSEGKRIYYLDETWINEGYTVKKFWQDGNITNARQAFNEGLSTGLKPPSGKGRRLIITHIGSESGFVDGGLLTFVSKKTGDYHEDMNSDVFEDWFSQMIDLIPDGSIIVMDNASYHSKKLERVPTLGSLKKDIQSWMTEKNISFPKDSVKRELLELVKLEVLRNKEKYTSFVIDEMAKKRNITVFRLPPYHCELNPIELIWAQVKGEVARNNTTYKLADVQILFQNAISNVSPENWRKCVEHVLKVEDKMWTVDMAVDAIVEPLIIHVNSNESGNDSFSSISEIEDC